MRALITGSEGFVGGYLGALLKSRGVDVTAFDLELGDDLLDYDHIFEVIKTTEPEHVYHLAAQTCVPDSLEDPRHSLETNVLGTLNLLNALRDRKFAGRVLLAGTSEEYGYAHDVERLHENSPTWPTTPYGVGKLAAGLLGAVYAQHYGLKIIHTRACNHVGPGQRGGVIAEWARQVVAIERGRQDELLHGDLDIYRSFMDVRDVVEAYVIALLGDLEPGVYNISPHTSVTLRTVLTWLQGLAKSYFEARPDPQLARPTEVKKFVSMSSGRFRTLTGWEPRRELETTLRDVLDWWRSQP
jgi:GDP-4-dehydro-6-deoxy-D-mannose reductase